MKNRYEKGTTVYSIYGGVFTYVKCLGFVKSQGEEKHELVDELSGDNFELFTSEFDKQRSKAWGAKRSI